MISLSKRTVATGVAAAAVAAAALSAPIASSWAADSPKLITGAYCYKNPDGEKNPLRYHLTNIGWRDIPHSETVGVMTADFDEEHWKDDEGYVVVRSAQAQAEVPVDGPLTDHTYVCKAFADNTTRGTQG